MAVNRTTENYVCQFIIVLLLAAGVTVVEVQSAELTPIAATGANSRVEFEEARSDDNQAADSDADIEIDLRLGLGLVVGANFGDVDFVDSVEISDTGSAVVKDNDGEDFVAMLYLHRRDYRGCRDINACLGWGPYVGLLTKPTGDPGGGWSVGIMGGFDSIPADVGFGYVVRKDVRYLVTDSETGLPGMAQGDFEGFTVMIGFSF